MRKKAVLGILLGMGMVLIAGQVVAHHSAAGLFSRDEEIVLKGNVKAWRMVNPHPALIFDVTDGEHSGETWTATFNSVADVRKHGWTRTTFKAGDPTEVLGNPFFGGQHTIFPLVVTTPDGKKHQMNEVRVLKDYAVGAHRVE